MAILALLSGALVYNFRSSGTSTNARVQTASVVMSDIRSAQSMAISGTQYQGSAVCGYGVRYFSPTQYQIFAQLKVGTCPSARRTYLGGVDPIVATKKLINANMSFTMPPFYDIYFELPDPKTYVRGIGLAAGPISTTINIVVTGTVSPATKITVSNSGKIDLQP